MPSGKIKPVGMRPPKILPIPPRPHEHTKVDSILHEMHFMTKKERLDIINNFCTVCGSTDPKCRCWDDE